MSSTLRTAEPTVTYEPRVDRLPQIRPHGIRWSGGAAGHALVIELDFENPDAVPTRATFASVQIAPLGAFLPWRPLTQVRVPPIPPRGRRTITTILDPEERDDADVEGLVRRDAAGGGVWATLHRWVESFRRPQDVHFVGNLNVFVDDSKPVERHVAPIHLDRRRSNVVDFFVGDGKLDEYTFSLESPAPGWAGSIQGLAFRGLPDAEAQVSGNVGWGDPVEFGTADLRLVLRAPKHVEADRVKLAVTRASTSQRVTLEFQLGVPDAAACYRL